MPNHNQDQDQDQDVFPSAPLSGYNFVLNEETVNKAQKYKKDIEERKATPGKFLRALIIKNSSQDTGTTFKQKNSFAAEQGYISPYFVNETLKTIDLETFIELIIQTKVPCVFAESQPHLDGNDWNSEETSILGDIGFHAQVTVYGDGKWGGSVNHESPFEGHLLFVPGALLKSSGQRTADMEEVDPENKKVHVDDEKFYNLYRRRLLPQLLEANKIAADEGKKAFVTLPGIGAGAFAGNYQKEQLQKKLKVALERILKENAGNLTNIAGIYYDPFDDTPAAEKKFEGISFIVNSTNQPGTRGAISQLQHPRKYGEEFKDCIFFSIVGWDHFSWPGNDLYGGSPWTDDGAKAAATSLMQVVTGIEGEYVKDHRYKSFTGGVFVTKENKTAKWQDSVVKNSVKLKTKGSIYVYQANGQRVSLDGCVAQKNLDKVISGFKPSVQEFIGQVKKGNLEYIRIVVGKYPDVAKAYCYLDGENVKALTIAAELGHLEIVKFLLENGMKISPYKAYNTNQTEICVAAKNGHKDVVVYLIEKGANVSTPDIDELLKNDNLKLEIREIIDAKRAEIAKKRAERNPEHLRTQLSSNIKTALKVSQHLQNVPEFVILANIIQHYVAIDVTLDLLKPKEEYSNKPEHTEEQDIEYDKLLDKVSDWAIYEAKSKCLLRVARKFGLSPKDPQTQELSSYLDIIYSQDKPDDVTYKEAVQGLKDMLIKARINHRYKDIYIANRDKIDAAIDSYVRGNENLENTKQVLIQLGIPNNKKLDTTLTKFCVLRTIEDPVKVRAKVLDEAAGIFHHVFAQEADILGGMERITFQGDEILYRGINNTNITRESIIERFNNIHRSEKEPKQGIAQHAFVVDGDQNRWYDGQASKSTAFSADPCVAMCYALPQVRKDRQENDSNKEGWIFEYRPKQGHQAINLGLYNATRAGYAEIDIEQVAPEEIIAAHRVQYNSGEANQYGCLINNKFDVVETIANPYYKLRGDENTVRGFIQVGQIIDVNVGNIISFINYNGKIRVTQPGESDFKEVSTREGNITYKRYKRPEQVQSEKRKEVTDEYVRSRRKGVSIPSRLEHKWRHDQEKYDKPYSEWLIEYNNNNFFKLSVGNVSVFEDGWFKFKRNNVYTEMSLWKCFISVEGDDLEKAADILKDKYFNNPEYNGVFNLAKIAIKQTGLNGRLAIIIYAPVVDGNNNPHPEKWSGLLSNIEKDFFAAGIKPRPLAKQEKAAGGSNAVDNKVPGSLYTYYKNDSYSWDNSPGYYQDVRVNGLKEIIEARFGGRNLTEDEQKEKDALLEIISLEHNDGARKIQTDDDLRKRFKAAGAGIVALQNPQAVVPEQSSKAKILVVHGNILEQQVDAVVNAANSDMLMGKYGVSGLSRAVHDRFGGEQLAYKMAEAARAKNTQLGKEKFPIKEGDYEYGKYIDKETTEEATNNTPRDRIVFVKEGDGHFLAIPVGQAVITKVDGGNINFVIHAVAPDCRNEEQFIERKELLRKAYVNAFEEAINNGVVNIAVPVLGSGVFKGKNTQEFSDNEIADVVAQVVYDYKDKFNNIIVCGKIPNNTEEPKILQYIRDRLDGIEKEDQVKKPSLLLDTDANGSVRPVTQEAVQHTSAASLISGEKFSLKPSTRNELKENRFLHGAHLIEIVTNAKPTGLFAGEFYTTTDTDSDELYSGLAERRVPSHLFNSLEKIYIADYVQNQLDSLSSRIGTKDDAEIRNCLAGDGDQVFKNINNLDMLFQEGSIFQRTILKIASAEEYQNIFSKESNVEKARAFRAFWLEYHQNKEKVDTLNNAINLLKDCDIKDQSINQQINNLRPSNNTTGWNISDSYDDRSSLKALSTRLQIVLEEAIQSNDEKLINAISTYLEAISAMGIRSTTNISTNLKDQSRTLKIDEKLNTSQDNDLINTLNELAKEQKAVSDNKAKQRISAEDIEKENSLKSELEKVEKDTVVIIEDNTLEKCVENAVLLLKNTEKDFIYTVLHQSGHWYGGWVMRDSNNRNKFNAFALNPMGINFYQTAQNKDLPDDISLVVINTDVQHDSHSCSLWSAAICSYLMQIVQPHNMRAEDLANFTWSNDHKDAVRSIFGLGGGVDTGTPHSFLYNISYDNETQIVNESRDGDVISDLDDIHSEIQDQQKDSSANEEKEAQAKKLQEEQAEVQRKKLEDQQRKQEQDLKAKQEAEARLKAEEDARRAEADRKAQEEQANSTIVINSSAANGGNSFEEERFQHYMHTDRKVIPVSNDDTPAVRVVEVTNKIQEALIQAESVIIAEDKKLPFARMLDYASEKRVKKVAGNNHQLQSYTNKYKNMKLEDLGFSTKTDEDTIAAKIALKILVNGDSDKEETKNKIRTVSAERLAQDKELLVRHANNFLSNGNQDVARTEKAYGGVGMTIEAVFDKDGKINGLEVKGLAQDGSAKACGIKVGDIITEIYKDGQKISLCDNLNGKTPEQAVESISHAIRGEVGDTRGVKLRNGNKIENIPLMPIKLKGDKLAVFSFEESEQEKQPDENKRRGFQSNLLITRTDNYSGLMA